MMLFSRSVKPTRSTAPTALEDGTATVGVTSVWMRSSLTVSTRACVLPGSQESDARYVGTHGCTIIFNVSDLDHTYSYVLKLLDYCCLTLGAAAAPT